MSSVIKGGTKFQEEKEKPTPSMYMELVIIPLFVCTEDMKIRVQERGSEGKKDTDCGHYTLAATHFSFINLALLRSKLCWRQSFIFGHACVSGRRC